LCSLSGVEKRRPTNAELQEQICTISDKSFLRSSLKTIKTSATDLGQHQKIILAPDTNAL